MNYRSVIVGADVEGKQPLRLSDIVDQTLAGYQDDLALCIVEPLEIHKLSEGQYRVFVKARFTESECKEIGAKFVDLIHELFAHEPTISQSSYLYFGDADGIGGQHEIFDANDELNITFPAACLSPWVEARTAPLRWSYSDLDTSELSVINSKFERYREKQKQLFGEVFSSVGSESEGAFLYNLLIPAAFQGKVEHSRAKRALGAIFLVVVTKSALPNTVCELLFLRLSLFMYYHHSAEAIDKLIVESGMDRYQRILSMLESPLGRLTSALSEVERDAQELRAILYEPSRGLLAARRKIADLFREGEIINTPDGGAIKLAHQPSFRYIPEKARAQWILAYLLASVRGERPKLPSARESLAFEIVFLKATIDNAQSPYHELAKAVDRLLPSPAREWCAGGMERVDQHSEDDSPLVDAIANFKEYLFQLLKPDYDGPLQIIHLYRLLGIGGAPSESLLVYEKCVLPALQDPFSTYAHPIEFLAMLLEQHDDWKDTSARKNFRMRATCQAACEGRTCNPKFSLEAPSNVWIQCEGEKQCKGFTEALVRLSKESIAASATGNRMLGNFKGPFAYLFNRASVAPTQIVYDNGILALKWERFLIRFDSKVLEFETLRSDVI